MRPKAKAPWPAVPMPWWQAAPDKAVVCVMTAPDKAVAQPWGWGGEILRIPAQGWESPSDSAKTQERGGQGTAVTWSHPDSMEVSQKQSRISGEELSWTKQVMLDARTHLHYSSKQGM